MRRPILHTIWDYVRAMYGDQAASGFWLVRGLWGAGPVGRVGLCLLGGGLPLAAALLSGVWAGGGAVLWFGLVVFAAAWAFTLTAATRLSLPAYVILCAYLAWYGVLIGGALAGTPAFALPTLWMAWLGGGVGRGVPRYRRWLWLWVLCFIAAYLTYGAWGLYRHLPHAWYWPGQLVLSLFYLGALALTDRWRKLLVLGRTFWASLGVVTVFYELAGWKDGGALRENVILSFQGILGLVDLFWMWLGGSLFVGALETGEWGTGKLGEWLPEKFTRWLWPAGWLAAAMMGYLLLWSSAPALLMRPLYRLGVYTWVDTWSYAVYWSVRGQVFVSLAALAALLAGWVLRQRQRWLALASALTPAWINGVWIAAFVGQLGYHQAMTAFWTVEAEAAAPLAFWPAFVLLGGLVWQMVTAGGDWSRASWARLYGLVGALLLLVSVAVVLVGAGSPTVILEYTLYSFLGILYLGIPLALRALLFRNEEAAPLSGGQLAALFGLGCLSAVVILGIDPYAGVHLALAPLLWVAALALLRRRLPSPETGWTGALAGGALALGFATFWMSPEMLPIPLLVFINTWQQRYVETVLDRPMMQAGQLWFTLLALATGAGVGLAWKLRRRPVWFVLALLICALFFVWAALRVS
ncbi:MAG TPA: hypothetical protein PKZ84_09390 [Anaerolineae bacterium]|nr:hypothetical protein [Anaerolineae bacterium]HQI84771.1 hypothetical protein [Anaerolineae bacterium]